MSDCHMTRRHRRTIGPVSRFERSPLPTLQDQVALFVSQRVPAGEPVDVGALRERCRADRLSFFDRHPPHESTGATEAAEIFERVLERVLARYSRIEGAAA